MTCPFPPSQRPHLPCLAQPHLPDTLNYTLNHTEFPKQVVIFTPARFCTRTSPLSGPAPAPALVDLAASC